MKTALAIAVWIAVWLVGIMLMKPDCPEGSVLRGTRTGWYCVVEPLRKAP